MTDTNQASVTDKNLDRLSSLLERELEQPMLAKQIPDGAHIFHGSYEDDVLTQANLELASKVLLGMTLGYVKEAPLIMVFETKSGERTVIDLSEELEKDKAETFIQTFQEQTKQDMAEKINKTLAA